MVPISQITSPEGKTGRTMAFIALGLSIAVGLGTLVYLHHQIKLSKIKLADHENDPAAHKKSPA